MTEKKIKIHRKEDREPVMPNGGVSVVDFPNNQYAAMHFMEVCAKFCRSRCRLWARTAKEK